MNFLKATLKKIVLKYRHSIGRIILGSYLLIFILNIFHFHKYDFNSVLSIDFKKESNQHLLVSKSEFKCIIHQNLLSLQTALANFFSNNLLLDPKQSFYSSTENKNKFSLVHLSDNFLRAPPDQPIKN